MATRLPANCSIELSCDWMHCKVEVQVNLKSSSFRCYPAAHERSVDHYGDFPAQRCGILRAALLRGAWADPFGARRIGTSALSAGCVAPDCVHCVCPEDGAVPGGDRRGAGQASGKPGAA